MQQEKLVELSAMFHMLGHPTKLQILRYMMNVKASRSTDKFDYESVVPTLVATELNLQTAQASYSLKRMSEAKILTRNVSGRYTFYRIDPNFMAKVKEFFG